MPTEIGRVEALFRYPVKSMAGQALESTTLGWHGIEGDRRFAFRRTQERSGMPWLTASRLPELVLFKPQYVANNGEHPVLIRTPEGEELPIFGDELAKNVELRYGYPVQMMQLNQGIFDDASISVICSDTVHEIGRLASVNLDVRQFRPNILLRPLRPIAFQEDQWLGGSLTFGEADDAPTVAITTHDVRCGMVNLNPDSALSSPEILKAIVRVNDNNAGVYGTVTRAGRLAVGQIVYLRSTNVLA